MTSINDLMRKYYPGGAAELYAGVSAEPDSQGWFTNPISVNALIDLLRPRNVIEVGTWKGSSAIAMARRARDRGLDTRVLCIDTWLGSEEHWLTPKYRRMLAMTHGRPQVYEVFRANVVAAGLSERIVPLSLPSNAAARVLAADGVRAELIYIDAAHDHDSVLEDLRAYWPLLAPGGLLWGDDYPFPPLKQAVHSFADEHGLNVLSHPRERSFVLAPSVEAVAALLDCGLIVDRRRSG